MQGGRAKRTIHYKSNTNAFFFKTTLISNKGISLEMTYYQPNGFIFVSFATDVGLTHDFMNEDRNTLQISRYYFP